MGDCRSSYQPLSSFLRVFNPKTNRHERLSHKATQAQTPTMFWNPLASDDLLIFVSCESSRLRGNRQTGLMDSENSFSLVEWTRQSRASDMAKRPQVDWPELPRPHRGEGIPGIALQSPSTSNGWDPRGGGQRFSVMRSYLFQVSDRAGNVPEAHLFCTSSPRTGVNLGSPEVCAVLRRLSLITLQRKVQLGCDHGLATVLHVPERKTTSDRYH